MHPFSLNDEQIEQISGALYYPATGPYSRFPGPGDYTWGIGEDGSGLGNDPWMGTMEN